MKGPIEVEGIMPLRRAWLQVRSIGAVMFLLALSPIAAASYECVGAVSGTQISPTGVVMANSIAGITAPYLCSVNTTTNGVSTDACKAIYAMMLTAESQGRSVVLWFNDDPNTCSSHASWSWLTGWYWGPMLNPTG